MLELQEFPDFDITHLINFNINVSFMIFVILQDIIVPKKTIFYHLQNNCFTEDDY